MSQLKWRKTHGVRRRASLEAPGAGGSAKRPSIELTAVASGDLAAVLRRRQRSGELPPPLVIIERLRGSNSEDERMSSVTGGIVYDVALKPCLELHTSRTVLKSCHLHAAYAASVAVEHQPMSTCKQHVIRLSSPCDIW